MEGGAIVGTTGSIRWGHARAAVVEGYTVGRRPGVNGRAPRWTLRARVVAVDPYVFGQRPLRFVATVEGGQWGWPMVQVERVGDVVTAELGAPETDGLFRRG